MKNFLYWRVVAILNWFAARLLAKHSPKIIAITGSVGKTSTKRSVAAVVEQDYKTQWHDGNFNSEVGLPLALFELETPKHLFNPFSWLQIIFTMIAKLLVWRYPYELLVLELGIDKPGDMDRFLRYVHPDIGIVTAVQGAHLGAGLGTIETVYKEKTKLAKAAEIALANGDDELLRTRLIKELPKLYLYGTHPDHSFSSTITQNERGFIDVVCDEKTIHSQFIGKHSGLSLTAAWAVGNLLNIDPAQSVQALEELAPYPGRMNKFEGKQGSIILDDSYNNVSVQAAIQAIDTLMQFPSAGRKIVVMGSMNEMGDFSEQGHKQVGEYITKHQPDMLVTVGELAKKYMAPQAEASLKTVTSFLSPYKAGNYLAPLLKKGDVVLVKGSQNGVFTEEVTALLLKLDSDRSKLVRQSARWQRIKHQQFG